jgi:predicted lipid-binding transport protein (Tim44 family)
MRLGLVDDSWKLPACGDDLWPVVGRWLGVAAHGERASGRTVEGGERSEVTELWTFMRARGGIWLLSAIQQT